MSDLRDLHAAISAHLLPGLADIAAAYMTKRDILYVTGGLTPDAADKYAARHGYAHALSVRSWSDQKIWSSTISRIAIKYGHVNILRHVNPSPTHGPSLTRHAAEFGQLPCLKWLIEQSHESGGAVACYAATSGHIHILRWMHIQGLLEHDSCLCSAAAEGSLSALKWLRGTCLGECAECTCRDKERTPWDESTCDAAAENGRSDIIQWARAQTPPCPWDKDVLAVALGRKDRKMAIWLIANGCPM